MNDFPPLIIQKAGNGWIIFPAWMAAMGNLDLSLVRVFKDMGEKYLPSEDQAAIFLMDLAKNPANIPPEWLPPPRQFQLPLDTPQQS